MRVLLISDVNMANLAAVLRADQHQPRLEVKDSGFGSAIPVLHDANSPVWEPRPDLAVVWTRPEGVLGSLASAMRGERPDLDSLDREVDRFAAAVAGAVGRARWTLVPTWVPSFGSRGLGVVDLHDPTGVRALLARANARLLEALRKVPGCWVVDAQAWMEAGRGDRRLWYAAKVPYAAATFRAAARDIRAFLNAATGKARKLVILDLDNTLWGGIVGETGWEGLRLGGHDPVGEAFVDFQRALQALTRRGVVLAIASKNEESVALEAIRQHPEMVLREQDFAGWRIDWNDKVQNIGALLEELRLGADAAVFLDDSPSERGRVAEAFPTMLVPEWPADALTSVESLEALAGFDLLGLSAEDLARTQSYATERERRALRAKAASDEDWIAQLGVVVRLDRLGTSDLARAAQLLNKTNQMNLRTRRMSEAELAAWSEGENRSVLVCRVTDRFSDFGLTGLVSVEARDGTAYVEDLLLSCRVMTRRVEESLLRAAAMEAARLGASRLEVEFLPTARNAPMLSFLQSAGLEMSGENRFTRDASDAPPVPAGIEIRGPA